MLADNRHWAVHKCIMYMAIDGGFIHGIIPLSNAPRQRKPDRENQNRLLPANIGGLSYRHHGRLPRVASWEGAVSQAAFIFFHVHMLHSNVIQAISSALRFFGCAVGQSVASGVF